MNRRSFVSHRISSSSSNIPYLSSNSFNKDYRSRWINRLPRSNSSSIMRHHPDHQQLDLILKQLSDGKVFRSIGDDRTVSDTSEGISKHSVLTDEDDDDDDDDDDDGDRQQLETPKQSDLFSFDGDRTTLQRELQEKELDIRHLRKEIQELQLDNRILRDKIPLIQSNQKTTDGDVLQRENELLRNELRSLQELLAKSSTMPSSQLTRSNRFDQEKECWMKKLRDYEKQLRALTNENDKVKQSCQQLKRENEELHEKVIQTKKHNDDFLVQELQSLRNDLKLLQERHNSLFEENHRLKEKSSSQKTKEISKNFDGNDLSTTSEENESISMKYNSLNRSYYSPNRDEYYPYTRSTSKYFSSKFNGHYPTKDETPLSNLYKSLSNGVTNLIKDSRPLRDNMSNRRPYAPLSINDIRLNDLVKFSRPGGQISKGLVKYIGSLPNRYEHYLGLELDDEESQHDGVFQGQRFFQCKPNKGVFVSFNKVIMAYREK